MTTERDVALGRFAALFDDGHPWEAHEVLEAVWRVEGGRALKGLIQLAAVQVHLDAGRLGPARRVLTRALAHLEGAPDGWGPLDRVGVRADAARLAAALDAGATVGSLRMGRHLRLDR